MTYGRLYPRDTTRCVLIRLLWTRPLPQSSPVIANCQSVRRFVRSGWISRLILSDTEGRKQAQSTLLITCSRSSDTGQPRWQPGTKIQKWNTALKAVRRLRDT